MSDDATRVYPLAIWLSADAYGDVPLAEIQEGLDEWLGEHWTFTTASGTEVTIDGGTADWYLTGDEDDEDA